eukprot:TRINITY_DN5398_c0_g1_i6.p1 TRINITY_DN5398_c0_g1~~TRINITY_DN5398_c0_g1_i6.p1  ORF type:complete len:103 (-),score=18.61 TRINITY_DN5398_c0_g1_i6:128-436(-)
MIYLHGGFLILQLIDLFVFTKGFIFFQEHRVHLIIFSFVYLFVNFSATFYNQIPVYFMITYKDFASYVWILATLSLVLGTHLIFERLTKKTRLSAKHGSKSQ